MSNSTQGTNERAERNAKQLKKELINQGAKVTLGQVREALAKVGGFTDFNTLLGVTQSKSPKQADVVEIGVPCSYEARMGGKVEEVAFVAPIELAEAFKVVCSIEVSDQVERWKNAKDFDRLADEYPDTLTFPLCEAKACLSIILGGCYDLRAYETIPGEASRLYCSEAVAERFGGGIYMCWPDKKGEYYQIDIPLEDIPTPSDVKKMVVQVARAHHNRLSSAYEESGFPMYGFYDYIPKAPEIPAPIKSVLPVNEKDRAVMDRAYETLMKESCQTISEFVKVPGRKYRLISPYVNDAVVFLTQLGDKIKGLQIFTKPIPNTPTSGGAIGRDISIVTSEDVGIEDLREVVRMCWRENAHCDHTHFEVLLQTLDHYDSFTGERNFDIVMEKDENAPWVVSVRSDGKLKSLRLTGVGSLELIEYLFKAEGVDIIETPEGYYERKDYIKDCGPELRLV